MIWLSGIVKEELLEIEGTGFLVQPNMGNRPPAPGVLFGIDNGCFTQPHRYTEDGYLDFIRARPNALFATAPDVVCDAAATLERSLPVLEKIRQAGAPAALCAQNGIENTEIPWDAFDCYFAGGDDDFKLGEVNRELSLEARSRGKWVHWGRVNSLKRLRIARDAGAHSADGTFLSRGPTQNLPRVARWMSALAEDHAEAFVGLEQA